MGFLGRESVLADLRLHQEQAGGVTAGTLKVLGASTVAYSNVCLWPSTERTALGVGGVPSETAQLTAWRVGESEAPRPDDSWTVGGVDYLVSAVTKRLWADESSGYCVYDCDVTGPGPR
jgi:hypothetical protein